LALEALPTDDLTDDDLADDDLTEEEAGLFTEDIDDLVPLVRPPMPEDLVDADIEDLVDPTPLLDLFMEELLTPALLDAEPMPLLLAEPVVDSLGVYTLPLPGPKKSRSWKWCGPCPHPP